MKYPDLYIDVIENKGRGVFTLKAIKADTKTLELQNEFYDRVKKTESF